jgi:hypothetical protein
MKKNLLLFASCLVFKGLFSQITFNHAYHEKNEMAQPYLVTINNDLYFMTMSMDVGSTSNYLYRHTNTGTLTYKLPVLNNYYPVTAFKTLDNMLLIAGTNQVCDVAPPVIGNFISKIDPNGNQVFFALDTLLSGDPVKAVTQHSDSSYFVFTDSMLYKHSKTGQFISKINLGIGNISSALLLQNGTILLSAMMGNGFCLVTISSSGSIMNLKPFAVPLRKLAFYNGQQIMGLSSFFGKLYKVSPNLDPIGNSGATSTLSVMDFACRQDTIYSVLSGNESWYSVTDTSFNSISTTSTGTEFFEQKAVCLSGDKTAILSDSRSKISYSFPEHYFVSLDMIDRMGNNNFKDDVTLLSVVADSTYTECDYYSLTNTYVCKTFLRAQVKIRNNSPRLLTSFKLNCFLESGVACGGYFYQQLFSSLTVPPGDSITVITNTFVMKRQGPVIPPAMSVNYCFYTTLPNGTTDKTFSDNEFCQQFSFLVTSLDEQEKASLVLTIYPNPFEESLTLHSDIGLRKVELYNALGILINTTMVTGQEIKLSTAELNPGIYFIKAESEKGTAVKKVVKQ